MNVKILKVSANELVDAKIEDGRKMQLPSIHTGWRFNFDKRSRDTANSYTYVLVTEEEPDVIEGCLIFQMLDKILPYMAFVEVAPHNQADPKRYEYVGGCLIAYAFKQSVIMGRGDYKAQLFFDVLEEFKPAETKLISLYRKKYGAQQISATRLVIMDEAGYKLVEKYLEP